MFPPITPKPTNPRFAIERSLSRYEVGLDDPWTLTEEDESVITCLR